MGESPNSHATLQFDRRVRLEFHGASITSTAHCPPVHDAVRWFCELDWVVDGIRERNYYGSRRAWCVVWIQEA